MMKNILNIYIYLRKPEAPASLTKRIVTLRNAFTFLHTFQKVQMNSLLFSEGTR